MTNETVALPGAVALEPPSTVLNPETVSTAVGAGTPSLSEGDDSIASVLENELARLKEAEKAEAAEVKTKAEDAAKDAKAKVEDAEKAEKDKDAKAEKEEEKPARKRSEDGKFVKAEKPEGQDAETEKGALERGATERAGQDEPRQSEGRKHAEPPARFLPEARAKWANVPNEVKAEFHRVSQEMEAEITRHREASQRYEAFKQFDEIARSNGRDLATDSIPKVVQFEQMVRTNPIAALEFALREVGPRKADGTPVSLYEVAQYVVQNGPQSVQSAASAPMQQSGPAPEVYQEIERLRAEITAMRAETTVVPVVQRFIAEHPDFNALEPQIEKIITSGIIDQIYGSGLSPEQKLAEAYRMAGGSVPSSRSDTPLAPAAHSEAEPARPVNPDAGKKSVRGAPTDGATPATDEIETDLHEMLRKEMRKLVA